MRLDCWCFYQIYGFLYHNSALTLFLEGKKEGLRTTHLKTSWTKYTSLDDGKIRQAFPLKKSGKYERELRTISELAQDYQGLNQGHQARGRAHSSRVF